MNSSGTDGSDGGESVVLPDAINVPFNQTRKFVLVEYPAVVMNVDKMLTSLGGENAVSRANADPSRRLELRFRPQDIFCKPACGDRFNTTNLLMKVVRRRKKKSSGLGAERREPEVTLHAEILGVVDTTYRFQSMVDFQYLPMQRNADGTKFDSVYKDIVPQKIEMPGWLSQSAPLFVPPLIFSRFDQPVDYHFRRDATAPDKSAQPVGNKKGDHQLEELASTEMEESNLIRVARHRRSVYTMFVSYGEKTPTKQVDAAIARAKLKPDPVNEELVRKLFEERPVWSKNAIVGNLNIDNSRLKTILPLFAYYFLTGPWRSLWVRIGYDPRKDPTAKKYQTLDFRVRQMSVDRMPISSKRGTFCYQKPTTVSKTQAQVALIQADDLGVGDAAVASTSTAGTREELEKITSTYTFIPNVLPPFRQMFYQLCDIQAPEVQAIVSRNDNKVLSIQEKVCTEKDGWCEADFGDKCRAVLSRYLKEMCERRFGCEFPPGKARGQRKRGKQSKKLVKKKVEEAEATDRLWPEAEVNDMETELLEFMDDGD